MKKILLLLLCMIASLAVFPQDGMYGRVAIYAELPDNINIPDEAKAQLESKLEQIILHYGLANNGLSGRFVLTAKVNVISKDVTPTTPVKISQKLEVVFMVGDVEENKVFESVTMSVSGIGSSETKSLVQAFQQIKVGNPNLKRLMESAQTKIVDYYRNNCDPIIVRANTLVQQQNYDQAMALLLSVPDVCNDCFVKCQNMVAEIYSTQIDYEGRVLIQEARNVWLVKKNYDNAEKALLLLSRINPSASCATEASTLVSEINSHLRSVEAQAAAARKAAWDFKLQQYRDQLADRRQAHADRVSLAKEAFNSLVQIGMAFGNNQPKQVIRGW